MNERIKFLREQTLKAVPVISPERASLMTDFYKKESEKEYSMPVMRALSFKYILENKKLCLNEGELIVGERGPAPKATPTYPELCVHSANDLKILDEREKIPFKVDESAKRILLEEVYPFWKGRSLRDKIFDEMDDRWKAAYDAGVFTEFMEQRAPGHTVADDKIYHKGMIDLRKEIQQAIDNLDLNIDYEAHNKKEELLGMDIAASAIIQFAKRYSNLLYLSAQKENDLTRKSELEAMADICSRVPANAPRNFHEALQYYWFIHLGVITELNTWDSFNPGRLDQHLYPFYVKDIEGGLLTKESAKELLQSFWIKFNNQPAPPK
jgi:trans-4-hydroxy-L-proline dehydratase